MFFYIIYLYAVDYNVMKRGEPGTKGIYSQNAVCECMAQGSFRDVNSNVSNVYLFLFSFIVS